MKKKCACIHSHTQICVISCHSHNSSTVNSTLKKLFENFLHSNNDEIYFNAFNVYKFVFYINKKKAKISFYV